MSIQGEYDSGENGMEALKQRIHSITDYQKPYIANLLKRMAQKSPDNVKVICDYIIAEQNEMNIKESTKEGKIKCLVRLSTYLNHKPFDKISKQDVLDYLTSLKKPECIDPQHRSIGTYNGRQMILLKFFRWLYNQDESDYTKRITPPCMQGIKRLHKNEKTPYKHTDIWSIREHGIFLKYCPDKRDRCYHALAEDMSARPHEILNLYFYRILSTTVMHSMTGSHMFESQTIKIHSLLVGTSKKHYSFTN